jgi:hypothetical protein
MGLYLNLASIVSIVCDSTGDDTSDAQVKIRRLVNEKGPGFLAITNWPFTRSDISFSITPSANYYSGSSYLPETFKRVMGAHLKDSSGKWYPLKEVSISERYGSWINPSSDSQGRPDEFCITRPESGYYQIEFNRLPDATYTFEADIELKWTPLTTSTSNLIVTDDYMETFCHFISMARARQQGDLELYGILKSEWWNPQDSIGSILGRALASIKGPLNRRQMTPPEPEPIYRDYNFRG